MPEFLLFLFVVVQKTPNLTENEIINWCHKLYIRIKYTNMVITYYISSAVLESNKRLPVGVSCKSLNIIWTQYFVLVKTLSYSMHNFKYAGITSSSESLPDGRKTELLYWAARAIITLDAPVSARKRRISLYVSISLEPPLRWWLISIYDATKINTESSLLGYHRNGHTFCNCFNGFIIIWMLRSLFFFPSMHSHSSNSTILNNVG